MAAAKRRWGRGCRGAAPSPWRLAGAWAGVTAAGPPGMPEGTPTADTHPRPRGAATRRNSQGRGGWRGSLPTPPANGPEPCKQSHRHGTKNGPRTREPVVARWALRTLCVMPGHAPPAPEPRGQAAEVWGLEGVVEKSWIVPFLKLLKDISLSENDRTSHTTPVTVMSPVCETDIWERVPPGRCEAGVTITISANQDTQALSPGWGHEPRGLKRQKSVLPQTWGPGARDRGVWSAVCPPPPLQLPEAPAIGSVPGLVTLPANSAPSTGRFSLCASASRLHAHKDHGLVGRGPP